MFLAFQTALQGTHGQQGVGLADNPALLAFEDQFQRQHARKILVDFANGGIEG